MLIFITSDQGQENKSQDGNLRIDRQVTFTIMVTYSFTPIFRTTQS